MRKLNKRKCKNCKKEFHKTKPLQYVCSVNCAIEYSRKKDIEKAKKESREKTKKAKDKLKTYSQRVQEARTIFQKYIRLRDKHQNCICCNEPESTYWDAGHFYKAELFSGVIFNEDNCHKQRRYCNKYLGGNEREYRIGLEKKIGIENIEQLQKLANETRQYKYSNEELEEIKVKYRKKIKELLSK